MRDGATVKVNGAAFVPTVCGALYWPDQATLIVSDLHFEKGTAYAARGALLPPYDTRATLKRLAAAIAAHAPRRVVSLGDAFHDVSAEARMDEADARQLEALTAAREWIWVLGNHDPVPPKRFAGEAVKAKRIGPVVFRHEPSEGASPGEIAGHLHPCARVATDGGSLRRRCFAGDGTRLVMPAYGAYAGALNVLDAAFAPLFAGVTAWVIGRAGVYPVDERVLLPDPAEAARLPRRAG